MPESVLYTLTVYYNVLVGGRFIFITTLWLNYPVNILSQVKEIKFIIKQQN